MVQVDGTVGAVLKSIDDAGIRQETLVIYTSDNGSFMYRRDEVDAVGHVQDETIQAYRAENHRANGPFRGTKADIYEAGHHVPFFVRWPEQVQPGSQSEKTICHVDCLATIAEITGVAVKDGHAVDSHSFLAQLRGQPASPRPGVINHSANGMFAIRHGKWKLIAGNGSGGRERPRGQPFAEPYQLYNLEDDIAETHNVIERHPDIAERLRGELESIRNLPNE